MSGGGVNINVKLKMKNKKRFSANYDSVISSGNLLEAWKEFLKGKRSKKDVQEFSINLIDNLFALHNDLLHHTYKHGGYQAFSIYDPKPRNVHKASVRDRLLHHAIYRILYPFFDKKFIADSYSCRLNKGTYKAINRFREFIYKVSENNTRTCWVLKCDVKKFFANIDHDILIRILREYIFDENIISLLGNVIVSFSSEKEGIGLPLGNLTSQLFVNIYMNKFDQFVKHKLKAKYYIRYSDDFVIFSENRKWLDEQIFAIRKFFHDELKLALHPNKIFIKTVFSGVDFLGLVNFIDHQILRTKTKRRMFKKISKGYADLQNGSMSKESYNQILQSYLGMLKHCRGYGIVKKMEEINSLRWFNS